MNSMMDRPILCCFQIKSATLFVGTFDLVNFIDRLFIFFLKFKFQKRFFKMFHMMILATLFASISNPSILENYYSPDSLNIKPQRGQNIDIEITGPIQTTSKSIGLNQGLLDKINQMNGLPELTPYASSSSHFISGLNGTNFKFNDYLLFNNNVLVTKRKLSFDLSF